MSQYFPFLPIFFWGGVIKLVEISSYFYILVILGFPLPPYSYPTSRKIIKYHSKFYHQFNPAMCSPLWLIVLVLSDDAAKDSHKVGHKRGTEKQSHTHRFR